MTRAAMLRRGCLVVACLALMLSALVRAGGGRLARRPRLPRAPLPLATRVGPQAIAISQNFK